MAAWNEQEPLFERPLGGHVKAEPSSRRGPTISVVIPAKNEALNLPQVLTRIPVSVDQVILVDGNSTDDTVAVARDLLPGIIVIGQSRKGKGNALACGFAAATGELIVMLDADGSTDPAEIPRFVDALTGGADFAKGSRFMPGAGSSDISRLRQMGNFWLNRIVNLLYRTHYTDLCYGYNAFRRDCLPVMGLDPGRPGDAPENSMLWGDGFEVETLINVRIAKAGLRVAEVPSFESSRYSGASNLHAFSDGLRVLRTIHAERRRRPATSAGVVRRHGRSLSGFAPRDAPGRRRNAAIVAAAGQMPAPVVDNVDLLVSPGVRLRPFDGQEESDS